MWDYKPKEEITIIYGYIHISQIFLMNNMKKGGETSKSKKLQILKRGTCIKSKIGMAWSRW